MPSRLLVAPLASTPPASIVPAGHRLAPVRRSDAEALGRTYSGRLRRPEGETTLDEAVDDVVRALDGGHGALLPAASLVAWDGAVVVGAVLAVLDAPWPDVPRGAFVIDLFVAGPHRSRGTGAALMRAAMAAAPGARIGLRVEDDAVAARALYARLGFVEPPGLLASWSTGRTCTRASSAPRAPTPRSACTS